MGGDGMRYTFHAIIFWSMLSSLVSWIVTCQNLHVTVLIKNNCPQWTPEFAKAKEGQSYKHLCITCDICHVILFVTQLQTDHSITLVNFCYAFIIVWCSLSVIACCDLKLHTKAVLKGKIKQYDDMISWTLLLSTLLR